MPPTPLHLGVALLACRAAPRLGCGALAAGSLAPDLEPGLVLLLGLDARLHGPLHTLAAALILGWLAGLLGGLVWGRLALPCPGGGGAYWALGGVLGWASHVVLDAPLYSDITPLEPLTSWNPAFMALGGATVPTVYAVALATTPLGLQAIAKARSSCNRTGNR